MKPLLDFEEYLKKGVAKRQRKDIPRANFLTEEANKSLIGVNKRVEILGFDEFSANSIIKDCYDIILELIRAKMLIEGFSCSGFSAHEAEVSFAKKLGFSKGELDFINEIRYIRNRIIYYGKQFDKEYAEKVYNFLIKTKKKLE